MLVTKQHEGMKGLAALNVRLRYCLWHYRLAHHLCTLALLPFVVVAVYHVVERLVVALVPGTTEPKATTGHAPFSRSIVTRACPPARGLQCTHNALT